MTVETGKIWFRDDFTTDLSLIGQITKLAKKRTNPAWEDECSKLNGMVAGVYRSNMTGTIKIYDAEMERPIEMEEVPTGKFARLVKRMVERFTGKQKVRKFTWSKNNFVGWFTHRSNICYQNTYRWTSFNDELGNSQRKSNHRASTPTVWSLPHYLDSDYCLKKFHGLQPNRSLHESFIEVETTTGAPIYERKNIQLNIDTSRSSVPRKLFLNFELFFPVAWFSEESKAVNHLP